MLTLYKSVVGIRVVSIRGRCPWCKVEGKVLSGSRCRTSYSVRVPVGKLNPYDRDETGFLDTRTY